MFIPWAHIDKDQFKRFWGGLPWPYKLLFASQITLVASAAAVTVLMAVTLFIQLFF